ncbi:Acyl-coenzyme A synthetase/AMP-(fatty) acid ligase [Rhodoferax sp. OV413]|uniref:AMP-binding protein n=1 Tax=Rhodoferax sp. OV413 TaxID=1855285 RepID=UPI00088FA744|nr:AMP-binding protein [Rhodoferax sp. OV413]SDO02269.1 Acyl-coenzyme A synthetase/AMP-(fatty) acid ligase [Rhodoferax sp. OV413]
MFEFISLTEVACGAGRHGRVVARQAGQARSHADFVADVGRWQTVFAQSTGLRWALYFEDGYQFACALYGAWHAGKTVFLPGDVQPGSVARLNAEVDGWAGDVPQGLCAASVDAAHARQALDLENTRLVLYTSGSSGEPEAIAKSLRQLEAEIGTLHQSFAARMPSEPQAHILTTVSHQHIYGLLFAILWPLASGMRFVAERLVYPEQMAQALGPEPSVLIASPAHLRRLPETLDWAAARQGVRMVFSSGGPLPPQAADDTLRLWGCSPVEVFGSSETGGIAWRQRREHGDTWQVFVGVQWRVAHEVLELRSPNLADSSWWRSTDRIAPTASGGFVLLGREDRIVKIEEKRVSLTAIERHLAQSPWVQEVRALVYQGRLAVVAVLTPEGNEALARLGKPAVNQRLRELLASVVEPVALPKRWRYPAQMPVNAQSKTTEALLLDLLRPTRPIAQWQQRDPAEARAVLDIQADLRVFDGHFPVAPVLPGVAQLDWAVSFGRECFPINGDFLRVETLKFQRPVRPGDRITLALTWRAAASTLVFAYRSGEQMHSSGRIVFAGPAHV